MSMENLDIDSSCSGPGIPGFTPINKPISSNTSPPSLSHDAASKRQLEHTESHTKSAKRLKTNRQPAPSKVNKKGSLPDRTTGDTHEQLLQTSMQRCPEGPCIAHLGNVFQDSTNKLNLEKQTSADSSVHQYGHDKLRESTGSLAYWSQAVSRPVEDDALMMDVMNTITPALGVQPDPCNEWENPDASLFGEVILPERLRPESKPGAMDRFGNLARSRSKRMPSSCMPSDKRKCDNKSPVDVSCGHSNMLSHMPPYTSNSVSRSGRLVPLSPHSVTAHSSEFNNGLHEDIGDKGFVDLADQFSAPRTPSQPKVNTSRKLQWNAPKDFKPSQSSPLRSSWTEFSNGLNTDSSLNNSSEVDQFSSSPLKHSPDRHLLDEPAFFPTVKQDGELIPFVDAADPPLPVQDRSPVPGLTHHGRIFTHFRLGSAVNHAAWLWRRKMLDSTMMEIYGRVISSSRDGHKQSFDLADMFYPHRPPNLQGEWIGWKGLAYFELDGSPFIGSEDKKLCRVVGRIIRDQDTKQWRMCVLSIWEAKWDDIEVARAVLGV